MAVMWNLKKWLAVERDIYKPSELQALLAEKVGVQLSLQAISTLVNKKPSALRLQTIEALCNALDCKLSDFCEVIPDPVNARKPPSDLDSATPLYGQNKKHSEHQESIFPDPEEFRNQA